MTWIEIHDQFAANQDKLRDPKWLAAFLRPHCRIKRLGWRSRLRVIQIPNEFSQWLILLASRNVRSYLEIGTSTGGSFFMTDAYLRAAVPGYLTSVGYDRFNKLTGLDEYKTRFHETYFRNVGSGDMQLGEESFDAAFVDARHVERWVLHDFEKVRRNAKIVGFHDIVLQGSTVGLAFDKIRKTHRKSWSFVDNEIPVEARCGIGAVET